MKVNPNLYFLLQQTLLQRLFSALCAALQMTHCTNRFIFKSRRSPSVHSRRWTHLGDDGGSFSPTAQKPMSSSERLNLSNVNTVSESSLLIHRSHTNTLQHSSGHVRDTRYRLRQITSCLRIPELYSPSQSSTFKWTPCGFLFSTVRCCLRLLFALRLRRSYTADLHAVLCHSVIEEIFGISHIFFQL